MLGALDRSAVLLGAEWGLTKAEEDRIDLATQEFLRRAEELRVVGLKLPSFRSKVGQGARDGPGDPSREEVDLLLEEMEEAAKAYRGEVGDSDED